MYNLSGIKEIANGDEEFLKMLVNTFISEVPPDVAGMIDAVNNGNSALAYQFSHKLKPNLKSFGVELDHELNSIEDWSQNKTEQDHAAQAAKRIDNVVSKVIADLKVDFGL